MFCPDCGAENSRSQKCGFMALIMICRYLLQMITPTAKTQMNWQAARTKSTT
jgi:hypothetical protein